MNQTEPHTIDDIREVTILEAFGPVNSEGNRIELPTLQWEQAHRRGWRCIVCEADFQQWPAVIAHLKGRKRG